MTNPYWEEEVRRQIKYLQESGALDMANMAAKLVHENPHMIPALHEAATALNIDTLNLVKEQLEAMMTIFQSSIASRQTLYIPNDLFAQFSTDIAIRMQKLALPTNIRHSLKVTVEDDEMTQISPRPATIPSHRSHFLVNPLEEYREQESASLKLDLAQLLSRPDRGRYTVVRIESGQLPPNSGLIHFDSRFSDSHQFHFEAYGPDARAHLQQIELQMIDQLHQLGHKITQLNIPMAQNITPAGKIVGMILDSYLHGEPVSQIIFENFDQALTRAQKGLFLLGIEYAIREGNESLHSFGFPSKGLRPETKRDLNCLLEVGLLRKESESKISRFSFMHNGRHIIENYLSMKQHHQAGKLGTVKPILDYRRIKLPPIKTGSKNFVQVLKSIERRHYEGKTGIVVRFKDKEAYDYEQATRLTYTYKQSGFFLNPAFGFEIIPLDPAPNYRIQVIAECYHPFVEDTFKIILLEIAEFWPEILQDPNLREYLVQHDKDSHARKDRLQTSNEPIAELRRDGDKIVPWSEITNVGYDQQMVKLWWAGHTANEIAKQIAGNALSGKTITNKLCSLRKIHGRAIVPLDSDRRKPGFRIISG